MSGPMALEGMNGNPELLSLVQMKFRFLTLAGTKWAIRFCYHGYTCHRTTKFASVLLRRPRGSCILGTTARRCLTGFLPARRAERSFFGLKTLIWSAAKRAMKPSSWKPLNGGSLTGTRGRTWEAYIRHT